MANNIYVQGGENVAHIYTLSISPIWNDDDSILLSFVSPIRQKKY